MPKILPSFRPFSGSARHAAAPFARRLRTAPLVEDVADILARSVVFAACVGAMFAMTGAGLRLLS